MLFYISSQQGGLLLLCPQALLALTSRLVIRRTLQEVVGEGYTVPQQHHHDVLVQPRHTHGFMMDLLKKAAQQVSAAALPNLSWAPCALHVVTPLQLAQHMW
jgi:hypothetical protein